MSVGGVVLGARPGAAELAEPAKAKAWKTAQEFEAMVLGQLVAPMFATVETSKGMFGGGAAEEQWKPMLSQEIGKHVAKGGGLGLAVPVYHQMLRAQEAADAARKAAQEGPSQEGSE
jgi:Rod binding domain-containing protein